LHIHMPHLVDMPLLNAVACDFDHCRHEKAFIMSTDAIAITRMAHNLNVRYSAGRRIATWPHGATGTGGAMTTLLLAGTTGLVGTAVRRQALDNADVGRIIALSRHPLAPADRLENQVVDFDRLPADAPWWAADAVICTLGTTM